ncbi:MAG: DUF3078 domain-containing protein [Bacteroidales bacterium]|nr:DUF3078 domain-containing protein [Candidatus Physcocola equi]
MKRVFFYILVFVLFPVSSLWAVGESPQQIINSLDAPLKGVRSSYVDSLKRQLSVQYVEDFRTYGRLAAYDSLCARVRMFKAANEHNSTDTLAAAIDIEPPMSEIDRLKQENQSLRNELAILKNGPDKEPELSQLQKRTRWIVKELVRINNFQCDSLDQIYRDSSFGKTPVFFDSMSADVLKPFMSEWTRPKYWLAKPQKPAFKTNFQRLYERNRIAQFSKRKMVYAMIGRDPSSVSFYQDGDYIDFSQNLPTETVRMEEDNDNHAFSFADFDEPRPRKNKTEKWTYKGKLDLQFTQYYVTDNWYKGGEPNATLLSILDYDANYREGRKYWENEFDVKLGFYTTFNDTTRAFRVNEDEISIASTMGYKTHFSPKWAYALRGRIKTQLFKNYKATNSKEIKTSFLTPTRIYFGPGMKFDYNNNVWLYVSPATYKLIFLVNDDIKDPKTVGIPEGKRSQNDFGISAEGRVKWRFTKDLNIESNMKVFAPYNLENVDFEWETVGTFRINRFISTRLSLSMVFDSTPESTDYESPKLQIKELLSLGLTYRFQ